MQIYKEKGYDLLDAKASTEKLEDLVKIQMFADGEEKFIIWNMSKHRVENEEDALNLLFIGHTNRVISDTPMNEVSTRSHCLFIINLES